MATRHLRRVQEASKASTPPPVKDATETEEDDDEEEDRAAKPFNPFDLLSDDEGATGELEEDGEEASASAAEESSPGPAATTAVAKPSSKASKKKKKAKKKGAKKGEEDSEEEEAGARPKGKAAAAPATKEEDLDAILRELNITTAGPAAGPSGSGATAAGAGAAGASAAPSVLCVDLKGLRGDEELRRIFGSDVVAAVDRQDRAAAAEGRRYGAAMRGLGGGGGGGRRRGLALKRGWLAAPREQWPPPEGGLSMELAGSKDGVPLFRYVHSAAYRATQERFHRCQASYDPNTIAALLHTAPYHVDSLIAMHDLYRHMGENSYAEELLDRALWALEAAWHPAFSPATAACRLDYRLEENRPLFGALFRHVQSLSRRGCHRAALEAAKLLLALEPAGDPSGALLLVDYLAIRAGSYEWLQRFVLTFEGSSSLALLPNFAFALPMAAALGERERERRQEKGQQGQAERAQPGGGGSGGSAASPHELLVGALLLHPLVLPRLVGRLQDKGAAKESYWKALLARKLYAGSGDGGSASLSHLAGLYVERSGELWKPPDLLALLRSAGDAAADIADGRAPPLGGISAADWAALARESFPPSASNEYRHLRLSDFSDVVNALPREEVEAAVGGNRGGGPPGPLGGGGFGGPLGAQGEVDMEEALAELQEQMILAQQQQAAAGGGAAGGGAPPIPAAELRGANPLLMLLRSMLPWVNAGQQPDYGAEGGAHGAGAPGQGGQAAAAEEEEEEWDDEDGHADDEEGVVRRVRR